MNERILFSALSSQTTRLANGSKLPDMDFAQVLAGRSRVLNSANPENKLVENRGISTLSIASIASRSKEKRGYLGAMYNAGSFNYKFNETGRQGDIMGGGLTLCGKWWTVATSVQTK